MPADVVASKHTVGAYTCLTLVHNGPISVSPVENQSKTFRAELVRVNFQAYMNRGCSWLNDGAPLPPEYIMQHEQIHFAIWELQARRMNRAAASIAKEVQATAGDPDLAVETTKDKLARVLERALTQLRKDNLAFDNDTSQGYFPDQQNQWFQRVQSALGTGETRPAAPAPTRPGAAPAPRKPSRSRP